LVLSYIEYLFRAKNQHSLHSPFLFQFYNEVINPNKEMPDLAILDIESTRKEMLKSPKVISVTDFGAGSKSNAGNQRKVKDIAKFAQKKPKIAQMLFRIVQFFKPHYIIDLGTSLGITTMYFAKAAPTAKIVTFEGCPNIADLAQSNFKENQIKNVEIVVGNIDETLNAKLVEIPQIDFAFFDANHRLEPTIAYFEACLPKINSSSVFVFDDIHWSSGMEKAWDYIKNHPKVLISIDLFFVGIVLFRTNQPKQDFVLR
jgi:predicted O-methyltransferase YrrM